MFFLYSVSDSKIDLSEETNLITHLWGPCLKPDKSYVWTYPPKLTPGKSNMIP